MYAIALLALKCRKLKKSPSGNERAPISGFRKKLSKSNFLSHFKIKWRKRKVRPAATKIFQELDGGFFERFGQGLQDSAAEPEAGAGVGAPGVNGHDADADAADAQESDDSEESAGDESATPEAAEREARSLFIQNIGWNIEELYVEVLYEIIHIVGADLSTDIQKESLFAFAQEVFKLDDETHHVLLETAQQKEAPNILLNVEVIEAKELSSKDANGLSDPFCTLFLSSAPTHRYNTSVKGQTLTPVWEEHFSLPVQNPADDILCVEVWDFDPAETVREKFTKISEVKGVRGLRKLMKEIAVTASTGKHDNELIGATQMPLKRVPADGQTVWCSLEKKSKVKRKGTVKLKMAFGSEKNTQVAAQEHRHILRLLLLHHIQTSKVPIYKWEGEFSLPAETIIRQHAAQSNLNMTNQSLARWIEFTWIHIDHPLSFTVFAELSSSILQPLLSGLLSEEEIKFFWDAAKKLLPSCLNNIRRLRKSSPGDEHSTKQLTAILSTLSNLASLEVPKDMDLLPKSVYGWLTPETPSNDIKSALNDAIVQGAVDWFLHTTEANKPEDSTDEAKLKNLIKIVLSLKSDLQRAMDHHEKIFQQTISIPYAKSIFAEYETKICDLCQPVIQEVCQKLKPLTFTAEDTIPENQYENDPLSMGTTLFELYLALQRFTAHGETFSRNGEDDYSISKFHTWFYRGVAQWLDIAVYKAMHRIEKAVEIDELEPVDVCVKYSSSAVDTLAIFYQIQIFWKQLAWPDIEGSYTFVAKIIDDICRCSVFYADKMSKKVENIGDVDSVYEKKFEVTNEWCLAINNIDYVQQSIAPFVDELGLSNIIGSLADFKSSAAAEHCKNTLTLVIDNAVDTVKNKIIELLETVANKMTPIMGRFLLEGAELLHQESNQVDRLMSYLDNNLTTLHTQLNNDNFERILSIIWNNVSKLMSDIVTDNLEKRRPPSFFSSLNETLDILVKFFKQGDFESTSNQEILANLQEILRLYGMETPQLIHEYYLERLSEIQRIEDVNCGELAIKAQFVDTTLRLEILNARNLLPMDSNGQCDPFLKVYFSPEDKFRNISKPKTKVQKKTLFPLFDESFTVHLSHEQRNCDKALLLFVVKDQDYLGMKKDFVAEAFILFSDIPVSTPGTHLDELNQIHLPLSRPSNNTDSKVLRALEHRQGEKLVKDFLKTQKQKMNPPVIK
nr:PREDICTED: protein unc-13 homolog 4B isoform X1 [Bemisia tabaci]